MFGSSEKPGMLDIYGGVYKCILLDFLLLFIYLKSRNVVGQWSKTLGLVPGDRKKKKT